MKYSAFCPCGYETPLVEYDEEIDWDLLDAHQEFCAVFAKTKWMKKIGWQKKSDIMKKVKATEEE